MGVNGIFGGKGKVNEDDDSKKFKNVLFGVIL